MLTRPRIRIGNNLVLLLIYSLFKNIFLPFSFSMMSDDTYIGPQPRSTCSLCTFCSIYLKWKYIQRKIISVWTSRLFDQVKKHRFPYSPMKSSNSFITSRSPISWNKRLILRKSFYELPHCRQEEGPRSSGPKDHCATHPGLKYKGDVII